MRYFSIQKIAFAYYLFSGLSLLFAGTNKEYLSPTAMVDVGVAWRRGWIEGFTNAPSIQAGNTVEFKVSTLEGKSTYNNDTFSVWCDMRIYRTRDIYYTTDISLTDTMGFAAPFYPLHDVSGNAIFPGDTSRFPYEYRRGCAWRTSKSFSIPSDWESGFYYAKVWSYNHPDSIGYIPFVVKSANPGGSSKILCVIAWNTYQAYNYWGGGSLYWNTGTFSSPDRDANGDPLIRVVSFRRPFGFHMHDLETVESQTGQFDLIERFFVHWAVNNSCAMDFCVDADIDNAVGLGLLDRYQAVIFPGHSEYWSLLQRKSVELRGGFKDHAANLAFFAANNCYWHVKYNPNEIATNNPDTMICDKEWTTANRGPSMWRLQSDTSAEARFIGVQFEGTNNDGNNKRNKVYNKNHWIFKGTNLDSAAEFGKGPNPLASGEADMIIPGKSPSNIQLLGRVNIRPMNTDDTHYGELQELGLDVLYSDVTYYEDAATNSRVFAAGGFGWCNSILLGDDSNTLSTMNRNILDHFSGKKYIGNVYTNINHPLAWSTTELDGDVNVLADKYLKIAGPTVTIDNGVSFSDSGTVEVNGNVSMVGSGCFVIKSGGTLLLKSNSTLTVSSSTNFVLEDGGQVIYESGARLVFEVYPFL